MSIDTINNFGLPFFGKFLISIKINGVQIFPQTSNTFKGGQTVIKHMKITESLFSPIVAGSITILDMFQGDNGAVNTPIIIEFNRNISSDDSSDDSDSIIFKGIITQSVVITDDAVKNTNMNSEQRYRMLQLDFMNEDIFIANQSTPWEIPKNDTEQTDFVGWIARKT